jgi:hypothetical protein
MMEARESNPRKIPPVGQLQVACPNVTKSVDVFVRPEDAKHFS